MVLYHFPLLNIQLIIANWPDKCYNVNSILGAYIMTQISKLLDDQVVEKAKAQLHKVGKTALMTRKLEAIIPFPELK